MFGVKQAATRVHFSSPSPLKHTYTRTQLLQLQSLLPATFQFAQNSSISPKMNPDVQRIHEFWFTRHPKEWFSPPEGFDQVCEKEFGSLVQKARTNELDGWASEPKSTLALLVLLDQFPRNIFRGTPDAFSSDSKALDIATKSIAKGWDREVSPYQALAFYLPLMHSENLLSTIACQALYQNLINQAPVDSEERKFLETGISFAIKRRDVILRFGRIPTRNAALGRQSTTEEEEFLKEH